MNTSGRFIALSFILLATLVGVGFTHGLWTERWAPIKTTPELQELKVESLKLDHWVGKTLSDESIPEILRDRQTYFTHQFVNERDGSVATMLLTYGRPGPMVLRHMPTECYPSSGYTDIVSQPRRFPIENDTTVPDEFWVATFKKPTTVGSPLIVRVYWSWSATGVWQTPDNPRIAFARYPGLYKLYVIQQLPNEEVSLNDDPVHDLIRKLTTALRASLFKSSAR